MKIKLLKPHGALKAGANWNCPWASLARKLIETGAALALEAGDRHLNPKGKGKRKVPSEPGSE